MRLRLFAVLLLVAAVGLVGCFSSRELSLIKRDIAYQAPGLQLDHQVTLSLGKFSIGFARLVTALVPERETQLVARYLRDVHHVEVAYYDVDRRAEPVELGLPRSVDRLMRRGDWVTAVKVREEEEQVLVFYREYYEHIRDMYVVVLTEEELVMVRVEGRLDELAEAVIRDHRRFISDEAGLGDLLGEMRP